MKVEALQPRPLIRQVFSLAAAKHVPPRPGCYVLATYDGSILYIGLASKLSARIKNHLDSVAKTAATESGRAHWFWYLECKSEAEINRLERGWQNQHELCEGRLPVLNSIHSPVS